MDCTFCMQDVKEAGHIGKCPECGGQTHLLNDALNCACCGKSFPAKSPKSPKVDAPQG